MKTLVIKILRVICLVLIVLIALLASPMILDGDILGSIISFMFMVPFILILSFTRKSVKRNPIKTVEPADKVVGYVEDNGVITKTDGSQISDHEIPWLIQGSLEHADEYERNSTNPKFHRTEKEEELSFNFNQKYGDKIQPFEEAIYNAAAAIGPCGKRWEKTATVEEIDEKIRSCNDAIQKYDALKAICYKAGRGGTIYFDDTWEHCHNSKNPDFSYISSIEELKIELEQLRLQKSAGA